MVRVEDADNDRGSALPSGSVAFLFTDIEGSTRRWDAYGDAMGDAVRRHDAILRHEIEARGGYIFKTMGDAFCGAFRSVGDALGAAVALQRALHREDFAAVDDLRVRVAIAAGEADERDGDYFGTAVNRTARLLSACHGAQILLTGEAADLAVQRLPEGVTLRHLGSVPLRDLKEPVRVYQAVAEGLRGDFKALRALETPPNNLPLQATSFVGRHEDVLRLERLLEKEALVSIVGAGGMGKTRLALEAAATTINDWKDGTWFVDLAAILDERLVVSVLLSTFGIDQNERELPLETLVKSLAQRETLILLDNCEHVIGEAARMVTAVRQRCPHVAILATSREALDIAGEYVYHLDSLDLSAAVKLFNERAAGARQSFSAKAEARAVEELCRHLDGIALAIELAAARVRSMPVRALVEHFDLRILAGGRDRQPRQKTMSALIAWSYDLLTDAEQDLLRRCSACVGGFTLEIAVALSGGDDLATIDLLSSLVDKSLVTADESRARYRLLEPIRQFANAKLEESGERQGALESHARAYAALAHDGFEEWDADPKPDWLERFDRELGNLRAALQWTVEGKHDLATGASLAADAAPVFLRLSLLSEGIDWCERFLRENEALPPAVEARMRYGLSMLYNNQGVNKNALAEALVAASLFQRARDGRGAARALSQVSNHYARLDRFSEARSAAEDALHLARDLDDRRLLADVLRRCARSYADDGDDAVRDRYAESVSISRRLGHSDDVSRALMWWGQFELGVGNYLRAAEMLLEARDLASDDAALTLLNNVVPCYLAMGDTPNAYALAREALALAAKYRHPIHTPSIVMYVAALAANTESTESARLIGYAKERLRAAGWRRAPHDDVIVERLEGALRRQLPPADLTALRVEGTAFTEDQAVAHARSLMERLTVA